MSDLLIQTIDIIFLFRNKETLANVRVAIHIKLIDKNRQEILDNPATEAATDEGNSKNSNTFEDLLATIATKTTQPITNIKDPIDVILDEYCDAPVMPITDDPLMFWKEWHESGNPLKQKFSDLAVESMTPPGTSVEAERFFSKASQVVPPKASNTTPQNLDKKLFCHENLSAVNYEY